MPQNDPDLTQFFTEFDQTLTGAPRASTQVTGETARLLQIGELAAQNHLSRKSAVQRSLRAHLLNRLAQPALVKAGALGKAPLRKGGFLSPQQGVPLMKSRWIYPALAVLALIIAFSVTPSARAFAQDLWRKIGPFTITHDPTAAQVAAQNEMGATPTAISGQPTAVPGASVAADPSSAGSGQPTPRPGEGSGKDRAASGQPTPLPNGSSSLQALTRAEALAQYGFDALEPAYLPDGYTLMDTPQILHDPTAWMGQTRSIHVYSAAGVENSYLSIQQSTYSEANAMQFAVGDAPVSDVVVRGQAGTWIEQTPVMTIGDGQGNNLILPVNYLIWEENGSLFVIDSPELSQAQLLKIAEGLK